MRYVFHFWLSLLSVCFVANTAWADPYENGLEAYKDGDYSKAYKLLGRAAKKTRDKFDKASMMVLQGASAVKMSRNSKAKTLFAKALKLDPDVQLPSVALRDRKVKKVFEAAGNDSEEDSLASDDAFADDFDSERGSRRKDRKKDRDRDEDDFGARDSFSKSDRKRGDKSKDKGFPVYSYFLPLGINEFYQGKTVHGVAFGFLQGLGGFLFFTGNQKAAEGDASAKAAFEGAKAQNAEDDPNLLKFLNDNETYVKSQRQLATIGLLILPAAYALSVADAAYGFLGSPPSRKKATSLLPSARDEAFASESYAVPMNVWTYDWGLLPRAEPTLYLSVQKQF